MTRGLIINADDLGADRYRNAGIVAAVKAGSVTSASILANGPAIQDALTHLGAWGRERVSPGIHINLSEGMPLTEGLRLLTAPGGGFRGKREARALLMNDGDRHLAEEVAREIEAQVGLLVNSGIPISHIDGHQHVHIFPAVLPQVLEAARRHHIPWIRIPFESPPDSPLLPVPDERFREALLFSELGAKALGLLTGQPVRTTEGFLGLFWKGFLTVPALREALRQLPPGLTELMVHPGITPPHPVDSPFAGFTTNEREQELHVLQGRHFREMIRSEGIDLVPFPEVSI